MPKCRNLICKNKYILCENKLTKIMNKSETNQTESNIVSYFCYILSQSKYVFLNRPKNKLLLVNGIVSVWHVHMRNLHSSFSLWVAVLIFGIWAFAGIIFYNQSSVKLVSYIKGLVSKRQKKLIFSRQPNTI